MIRVLCVFSNLNRGGAETMCMNLYRKIDRTKIQFDFVKHTSEKGAFGDEIRNLGGNIYTAPKFRIANYTQYCNWWKNHFKKHPEHQIIHGHMFTISSLYFNVAHKFNRVTIGHSHSSQPNGRSITIKNIIKTVIRKKVPFTSDYCLACSDRAGKFLYGDKSFLVLKNAINTEPFIFNIDVRNKMRNTFEYKNSDIVLCVVANFSEAKNPIGVVDIFKKIHTDNPNTRLLWVGDGPLRNSFGEKVKEYGLNDTVKLLGVRSDTFDVLQAADIFMLGSIFEGLPVSAIEAQASGLPCLLSDGISKETDITGLCKFLPIDKPELWVEAISNIDFTKRKNTKEEIIAAGYDVETTAKWLEEFYINIVKERNLSNE